VNWPLVMALALAIDVAIGWPEPIFRRIGHPVTWLGALIDRLDETLNRPGAKSRRGAGIVAALTTIAVAVAPAIAVTAALPEGPAGVLIAALLAAPLLAARSLEHHVAPVGRALSTGDLEAARAAVARIVGRDPERLDAGGVARAALESLAENASDAVLAPLFWGALLGLPGIAGYKAINTLDSMIGHRTPRHAAFGWFSARLDDLVNWPAARLTGLVLALAGGRPGRSMAVMRADARRHRSPNAGWPEAALAGALGCRLSGPRIYDEGAAEEPWLNGDAPDPGPGDVARGLTIYCRCVALAGTLLAAWALAVGLM
jgi:adenosylcobinamide-phosphate synthase